ncbi:MAG: hypothetical protein ACREVK_03505 [Gammaproteobacteria bacterium]
MGSAWPMSRRWSRPPWGEGGREDYRVDVEALKRLPILLPQSQVAAAPVGKAMAAQAHGPA